MTVTQHQIQSIDRSNVPGIINAIIRDGGCIIKGFTDIDTVRKVNAEVRPTLDADKPWVVSRQSFGIYTNTLLIVTIFFILRATSSRLKPDVAPT